jgi:hypothetical protein
MDTFRAGKLADALALADEGTRLYPTFTLPSKPGQPSPTFAQVAEVCRRKMPAPIVAEPEPEPVAVPVPVEESAPLQAQAQNPVAEPEPAKQLEVVVADPQGRDYARGADLAAAIVAADNLGPGATLMQLDAQLCKTGEVLYAVPKPPDQEDQVAAPAPSAQPEPVEVKTLRIVHTADAPTSIFGVEKDSAAHRIVGTRKRGGLGWQWWAPTKAFYLSGSKGFAPNMDRIGEAVQRLEAQEQDGQRLYRVELEIATTDVVGKELPRKQTAAEHKAWQREYDSRHNSGLWNLSVGKGACRCGTRGLSVHTGRVVKGDDGMPVVKCYPCLGLPMPEPEPEPVATLLQEEETLDLGDVAAALLAISAEPAPVPPSAECPSCRQLIEVVKGRLQVHTRSPYGGSACPGKLGRAVTDVEPEPAATLKKTAAKTTAPQRDQQNAPESVTGAAWKFRLADDARLRQTATQLRSDLLHRVGTISRQQGVRFEVRSDKTDRTLLVTVVEAGEGVDGRTLALQVKGTALTVRGVGRLIRA